MGLVFVAEHVTNTRSGTVVGTPIYMAPEQSLGKKKIDHRADIYSLGVILEVLAGRVPYRVSSFGELVVVQASLPFPSVRETRPEVPEPLEQALLKAVARDPGTRWPHMMAFRDALAAAVPGAARARVMPVGQGSTAGGRSGETRPGSSLLTGELPGRRSPWPAVAGRALALGGAGAGAATSSSRGAGAGPSAARTTSPGTRRSASPRVTAAVQRAASEGFSTVPRST
jgi:serine/threonine-protein kinase